ncbi:MAG: hypothetical protein QOK48_1762, partial [Blastocatellia bacterium]|nr:hypothetical protein [Blastocatellia bacterium]
MAATRIYYAAREKEASIEVSTTRVSGWVKEAMQAQLCGSAAAQCGKPMAYRHEFFSPSEAPPLSC